MPTAAVTRPEQPQPTPASLKRLEAVERAAEKGGELYTAAKAKLPPELRERVQAVEEKAAPLVHKAQDKGATLLQAADARVDAAVSGVSAAYERNAAFLAEQVDRQKKIHEKNLETYKAAREAYLKKVEDAVEYLKQRGVTGAARDAADEVLARVGEAKAAAGRAAGTLVHKVQEAVERLLSYGPVSSAVEAAKPSIEAAKGQYMRVHDSVVASQRYRQAYDLAGVWAQRAQQTWLYSQARQRVPQSAVDTALPYYNQLVEHLQPVEAGRA